MQKTHYWLIGLGALACVVAACQPSQKRDQDGPASSFAPTEHWVQSQRLRAIMVDLERQVRTTWPQEIEDEYRAGAGSRSAAKALEEACWLADGLAGAAQRIPDAVAHIDMAEVDRRSFMAQVETLRDQAQQLELVAGNADVEGMRRVLDTIDQTCNSCHERFRDFSGPIRRP